MRRRPRAATLWLVIAALLPAAPASAGPPGFLDDVGTRHDLVPRTNGTFVAGALGLGVADPDGDGLGVVNLDSVSWRNWHVDSPGCDRHLFVDLEYVPSNATGQRDAPADVAYTFRVVVTQGAHRAERIIGTPVRDLFVATVPGNGSLDIDLVLQVGLDVDWSFRAEGRQNFGAPGCEPDPL